MSKSFVQLVCPVSGKRAKVPYDTIEDGAFVILEGDDVLDLPVNWGRLIFDIVVPNPEVAEVEATRAAAVQNELDALRAFLASDAPEEHKALTQAKLDNGEALKEYKANAEEAYPMPDRATVTARAMFAVLSDEATGTGLQSLRGAGFPFQGVS